MFSGGDTRVERPVGDRPLGGVISPRPSVLERIGEQGVDQTARKNQRETKIAALEGGAAVGEGPLENAPEIRVVHEVELTRRRCGAGRSRHRVRV